MDLLNNMWRNFCINDTYEPGSIFKTVTATAALETGVVGLMILSHVLVQRLFLTEE